MTKTAKLLIEELTSKGITKADIADAMCDGNFLKDAGINQDTAEEIYDFCKK